MTSPHKCPICEGSGKLPDNSGFPYLNTTTGTSISMKTCHGCSGTGIVWEPNHSLFPHNIPINPWEDPSRHLPYNPNWVPTPFVKDPVVPLTWPSDFKFPDDVVDTSIEKLIKQFEDWIVTLKKERRHTALEELAKESQDLGLYDDKD